jgi:hypothetical protein
MEGTWLATKSTTERFTHRCLSMAGAEENYSRPIEDDRSFLNKSLFAERFMGVPQTTTHSFIPEATAEHTQHAAAHQGADDGPAARNENAELFFLGGTP